ncbi:MAG TPA: TIGR01777 family protein [Verrucomicrobiales bacterium]|jgi:uncharacterized protein (TIGR01777 family)|nr:TIGR01777 family protein [Verrucomicrobiales bacterium]
MMKKLLIAGANGFIARHLTDHFTKQGWEVAGLARRRTGLHEKCHFIEWDGLNQGEWVKEIDNCDVLINLVGRSINCRHTRENKQQILDSRVNSTKLLAHALAECSNPPQTWINGSASGIYDEAVDEAHGEEGQHGRGFISSVVKSWEEAFFSSDIPPTIRRIAIRISMVIADEPGNPYQILSTLAKFGLGGAAGNGRQMVSWIHIEDVCRAVQFIIGQPQIEGPVNLATTPALSNSEMMKQFRKSVRMPLGIPAPAFGVRVGAYLMGTAPELILDSCWVEPKLLTESGFVFKHKTICT